MLIEVLRQHLASAPAADHGWLAALHDPVLAPALALLHGDPARRWTVAELAAEAAVSRSVLDERFRQVLGRSPIRYLTEWRMHLAEELLATTDLGVVPDRPTRRLRIGGGVQPRVQARARRLAGTLARTRARRGWYIGHDIDERHDGSTPMSGRLDGKAVIVSGAGGGIGREHARLFAQEGASVLVNDTGRRTGADAASVVAEIEAAGGTAVADTTSATWDGAATIVEHALDAFGRVDVLVNNATAARNADLWQLTEAEWDLAQDVNLKGYFALIREVAPHFCGQGAGAIVNTSSGSGFGHPSAVAYAAAKEGVVGLTRTVARELGRFGVRCNAIRPLAVGRSTAEYSEATAKWTTLMALTMRPQRRSGVAVRGGDARDASTGEDLADGGVAVHRRRPRRERPDLPRDR